MAGIRLINGPNLDRLGRREPGLYGTDTLADIEKRLIELARAAGHTLDAVQSNAEHELIAAIHQAADDGLAWLIVNLGAYTHTSVALRDALLTAGLPFIEVHISNIHAREPFRHHSYVADIAAGSIVGLGVVGYELALEAAIRRLADSGGGH